MFGCLPGERATPLFLCFLIASSRAHLVAVCVSFRLPAFLPPTFTRLSAICGCFVLVCDILLWLMAVYIR